MIYIIIYFQEFKKNKLIKFKNKIDYKNLIKKNYNLIFNCDHKSSNNKKIFL